MFAVHNPLAFMEKLVGLKTSSKTKPFEFSLLIQTQATDRKQFLPFQSLKDKLN